MAREVSSPGSAPSAGGGYDGLCGGAGGYMIAADPAPKLPVLQAGRCSPQSVAL